MKVGNTKAGSAGLWFFQIREKQSFDKRPGVGNHVRDDLDGRMPSTPGYTMRDLPSPREFRFLTLAILPLAHSPLFAADFRFDAPAGPVFSEQEKHAQWEAGAHVLLTVVKAFHKGADSVSVPAGNYQFGPEHWRRDGELHPVIA